jgi:hypothetical protein
LYGVAPLYHSSASACTLTNKYKLHLNQPPPPTCLLAPTDKDEEYRPHRYSSALHWSRRAVGGGVLDHAQALTPDPSANRGPIQHGPARGCVGGPRSAGTTPRATTPRCVPRRPPHRPPHRPPYRPPHHAAPRNITPRRHITPPRRITLLHHRTITPPHHHTTTPPHHHTIIMLNSTRCSSALRCLPSLHVRRHSSTRSDVRSGRWSCSKVVLMTSIQRSTPPQQGAPRSSPWPSSTYCTPRFRN